jgi:hypothetical protein
MENAGAFPCSAFRTCVGDDFLKALSCQVEHLHCENIQALVQTLVLDMLRPGKQGTRGLNDSSHLLHSGIIPRYVDNAVGGYHYSTSIPTTKEDQDTLLQVIDCPHVFFLSFCFF